MPGAGRRHESAGADGRRDGELMPAPASRPQPRSFPRRALLSLGGLGAIAVAGLSTTSVVSPTQSYSMVVAGRQRAGIPVHVDGVSYGPDAERQSGQLFIPDPDHWSGGHSAPTYPVIMFIHGGGWTDTSGPLYCQAAARDLARYGVAVWLPTYRGTPSPGGWPMTFEDVSAALDFVAQLGEHGSFTPDLDRVHVTGHSAGGHLAAWVAARDQLSADFPGGTDDGGTGRIAVRSTTALAGVLDFQKAVHEDDDQWVVDVMGGLPEEFPRRYNALSPVDRLPMTIPVNVLHGNADDVVPVETLRDFLDEHARTGNRGQVILMDDVDHNDFVDVNHRAWLVAREVCLFSVGTR